MSEKRNFSRGIKDEQSLNLAKEFFSTGIGKDISEARFDGKKAFQVCIRDGYFNIYWNGCSVLKYAPNAKQNNHMIHYKYTSEVTNSKNPYLPLNLNNETDDFVLNGWSFRKNILEPAQKGDIPGFEKYIYSGIESSGEKTLKEKKYLSQYLSTEEPMVLDLEVAFTRDRHKEPSDSVKRQFVADRMDFARLKLNDDGQPTLQLVEAKLAKDKRLRAIDDPEIMHQIKRYKDFLEEEEDNIIRAYKCVADNYLELGLLDWSNKNREHLRAFIDQPKLDTRPYLLVLGTKDQMKGRNGICHWDRLKGFFDNKDPNLDMWAKE